MPPKVDAIKPDPAKLPKQVTIQPALDKGGMLPPVGDKVSCPVMAQDRYPVP